MKRSILIGAVAFLLGAASSPKAANENETLVMLCARWQSTGGEALKILRQKRPSDRPARYAADIAETDILDELSQTFCADLRGLIRTPLSAYAHPRP